jgi:ribonuclease HI
MSNGWVKLHRSCIENDWLKNPKMWVFWTYCLMKASWQDRTAKFNFKDVEIKRGQFVFGINKASEETGLSPQTIRTCLKSLKSNRSLTVKSTSKYSLVTVTNWALYQGDEVEVTSTSTSISTSKQHSTNIQLTTDKNIKKSNNIKKENKSAVKSVDLPTDFDEYVTKFYNEYIMTHYPRSTTKIENERKAVRLLLNKDYNSLSDYHDVLKFLQDDSFWRGNIQSINKLTKIKDGVRYFDKILTKSRELRFTTDKGKTNSQRQTTDISRIKTI